MEIGREQGSADCRAIVSRYLQREADDPFLGTKERRIANRETTSSEAETHAARIALSDAGVDPGEVDAILSWALVPDRVGPSNSCRVAQDLGAINAWTATVDAACASVVVQLNIAAGLIESGRARHVLLTQSHLVDRAVPMMHPASPVVGDGATAVLVAASETPGITRIHARTHGEYYKAVLWVRGMSDETDNPWWEPGSAFLIGTRAPKAAYRLIQDTVQIGAQTVTELLEATPIQPKDIDVFVSVQPRGWVPGAIGEVLGIDSDKIPCTFLRYAHLGGVGVVANLIEARERGLLRPGSNLVMYAQGAGFTRGAALVRW